MNSSASGDDGEVRELVLSAQSGNEDALGQLCDRYENLLKSIAHDNSLDYNDVSTEALYSFYRAVDSYDGKRKEVTFGLYARICVNNAMIDFKRHQKRHSRIMLADDCDVDAIAVSDGTQKRLEAKEESAIFYSRVKKLLSEFEYKVFELWSKGYKTAEISEELAVKSKRVDNAKARMLKKLSEEFGSERKN